MLQRSQILDEKRRRSKEDTDQRRTGSAEDRFTGNTDDPEPRGKHRVVGVRDTIDILDFIERAVLEYGK